MAYLYWSEGNRGTSGYSTLGDFEYFETNRQRDGEVHITFDRATPETGPLPMGPLNLILEVYDPVFDGNDPIGGTITSAWYEKDIAGYQQLRISGLDHDYADFLDLMTLGAGAQAFGYLNDDGNQYYGSLDASEPGYGNGDYIITGAGDDYVYAKTGDDVIVDCGGRDRYFGWGGSDTLIYSDRPDQVAPLQDAVGLRVRLDLGFVRGPDALRDKIRDIEEVQGTAIADVFVGRRDDADRFAGLAGEDRFIGRHGEGADTLRYDLDAGAGGTEGITAHLRKGFVLDGFGDRDFVVGIENVVGTNAADSFRDDHKSNEFFGLKGRDQFFLSQGADTVSGGLGADLFVFSRTFDRDRILDFSVDDGDRMRISNVTELEDLEITENRFGNAQISASNGVVVLVGVESADVGEDFFVF